jgi:SAM-dependent methyltransferase
MARQDQIRWDNRYLSPRWEDARSPHPLLCQYASPLPGGLALDIACGLGHNSLWLAQLGYQVLGVDISRIALARAKADAFSNDLGARILFVQADLDAFPLREAHFDLICVFRFLDRSLFPVMRSTLKPGGQLIYATLNWRWSQTHPETDARYLLLPGEFIRSFTGYSIQHHDETGNISQLVARKPA